jgi:hypothetical protein
MSGKDISFISIQPAQPCHHARAGHRHARSYAGNDAQSTGDQQGHADDPGRQL